MMAFTKKKKVKGPTQKKFLSLKKCKNQWGMGKDDETNQIREKKEILNISKKIPILRLKKAEIFHF